MLAMNDLVSPSRLAPSDETLVAALVTLISQPHIMARAMHPHPQETTVQEIIVYGQSDTNHFIAKIKSKTITDAMVDTSFGARTQKFQVNKGIIFLPRPDQPIFLPLRASPQKSIMIAADRYDFKPIFYLSEQYGVITKWLKFGLDGCYLSEGTTTSAL